MVNFDRTAWQDCAKISKLIGDSSAVYAYERGFSAKNGWLVDILR